MRASKFTSPLMCLHLTVAHEVLTGDGSVDLVIEDELKKPKSRTPETRPRTTAAVTQQSSTTDINNHHPLQPAVSLNGNFTTANTTNVTKEAKEETEKAKKGSTTTTNLPNSKPLTITIPPSNYTATIATPMALPKQLASVTMATKSSKPLSWDEASTGMSTHSPKTSKEKGKLDSSNRCM